MLGSELNKTGSVDAFDGEGQILPAQPPRDPQLVHSVQRSYPLPEAGVGAARVAKNPALTVSTPDD